MNPVMALKDLAEQRLEELGRTPTEAARIGGFERNFILDILRGKKQSVQGRNLARLARSIDVDPSAVAEAMAAPVGSTGTQPRASFPDVVRADVAIPDAGAMPRDLPIFGTAGGSPIGKAGAFLIDRSKAVGYGRRFPVLAGESEAYAFYIPESSMVPMHSPGELRVAHPHRPVRPGDSVLVLVDTGDDRKTRALIKIYHGQDGDHVVLGQLNPKATIRLKATTIKAMHHIMTQNELFEA
jgi:hypothetical protein